MKGDELRCTENGIEKEEMDRRAMTKAGHKMVQRRKS